MRLVISIGLSHPDPQRLLCDLPDNILLAIMSQADDVSVFCLRRVSRVFLRLFKDRRFRRLHDDSFIKWPFRQQSPPWKCEKVPANIQPILRPLLQKNLYCQACRNTGSEAELRLRTKLLYCSGCRTKHPAGLFSYVQRYGPSEMRICIGREGNIRICDHKVITWANVEEWFANGAHLTKLECRHRDHKYDLVSHCPAQEQYPMKSYLGHHCGNIRCARIHPIASPEPFIHVQWRSHMNVPGLGLTAAVDGPDVFRQVDWLRQHGVADIFPQRHGKYPSELQFFDPSSCTCLRFDTPPDGWGR